MNSCATGRREGWVEPELGGEVKSRGYTVVTDSVRPASFLLLRAENAAATQFAIQGEWREKALFQFAAPLDYKDDVSEDVIDGQQRLTSFFSFLDGKFPDGGDFKLTSDSV